MIGRSLGEKMIDMIDQDQDQEHLVRNDRSLDPDLVHPPLEALDPRVISHLETLPAVIDEGVFLLKRLREKQRRRRCRS